ILLATIVINVLFIIDTSRKLQQQQSLPDTRHHQLPSSSSSGQPVGRLNQPLDGQSASSSSRWITIDVLSSQSKVSVSVDGTLIVEEGDAASGRGIHVLVLNERSGAVMARRIFDTYSPHEDEAMALFLSLLADGRIVILAVKDEGTFQMKRAARDFLRRL